jgi:signal transduction histidine kinase
VMVVTKESSTQGQRTSGISRRIATWLAWSLCAVCVALIGLALLLDFLTGEVIPAGTPGERPGPALAVLTGVLSLAFPTVGALIASRLPANPIGWLFCGMGVLYTAGRFTGAYADYALNENFAFPGGEYVAWFSSCLWFASLTLGVFLVLLFPDGHLPSRWWRLVAWAAILGVALAVLGFGFMPDYLIVTHPYVENPFGIIGVIGGGLTTYELFGASRFLGMTLLLASSLAALFSVFVRLHHTRGNERQQIKWFLFAAVPLTVFLGLFELSLIITNLTYDFLTYDFLNRIAVIVSCRCPSYSRLPGQALKAIQLVALLALLFVPIVTYIAILRYRLYDIDVVINRTLVYGSLSACVVLIYVLAVIALGALFQAQGNIAVSLLATGLVAVLFQPLRSRLQRGVNRLMYGERDEPYAVISRLGRRLESTLAPDTVLPTLVETIAQALKLPFTAILLKEGEGFRTAAAYGSPRGEPETLPLVYQREEIGRLVLSPRAPGEGFSHADRVLLEDLARQAEVAVHAVRLTSDLQHSRERLVATREEERRRLRRDLHDGLGAQLAGLNVQAGTLRRLIPSDPGAADELVVELREELKGAISDIRRLVYGLRPPALDDLGLAEALRRLAERYGSEGEHPRVSVKAPEDLPDLPAAIEVAVYRIAQEALTNVARHAKAQGCMVRLAVDGDVELEIIDDGVGIPAGRNAGVGLSSMRERASELGGSCLIDSVPEGGTRVIVRLPLAKG